MVKKALILSSLLLFTGCVERGYQLSVNKTTNTVTAVKSVDISEKSSTKKDIDQMTIAVSTEQTKQETKKSVKPESKKTNTTRKPIPPAKEVKDNKELEAAKKAESQKRANEKKAKELEAKKEREALAKKQEQEKKAQERAAKKEREALEAKLQKEKAAEAKRKEAQLKAAKEKKEKAALEQKLAKEKALKEQKAKAEKAALEQKLAKEKALKEQKAKAEKAALEQKLAKEKAAQLQKEKEAKARQAEKEKEAARVKKLNEEKRRKYEASQKKPKSATTESLNFKPSKQTFHKFGTSEIHGHVVYMNPASQEISLKNTKVYLLQKSEKLDNWYNNYYLMNKESSSLSKSVVNYINATHLNLEKNFAFYGLAPGIYYVIIESDYPAHMAKGKKVYIAKKINVEKYKKIMTVFSKKL